MRLVSWGAGQAQRGLVTCLGSTSWEGLRVGSGMCHVAGLQEMGGRERSNIHAQPDAGDALVFPFREL